MDKIRKNKLAIFLFIFPAAVLFIGIIIVPIIMSAIYSFHEWDGITDMKFIGVKNYIELFTSESAGFPKTILNSKQ